MSATHSPRRSLRRALSLASAGALLLALAPAGVAGAQTPEEPRDIGFVCQEPYEAEFDDVGEDNTHFEPIVCAADYEIARGHPDDTYRPSNSVRRDQMASFVVRLIETAGDEELEEGDEGFDDVDEDSEHAANINKLVNIEVVEGFEDGTYRPRETVTRDQMASFIRRAIAYLDNEDARDDSAPPAAAEQFDDIGSASPHYDAANALAAQRIVVGDGEGTYQPRNDVRRDQMASFLMRGYDYAAEARLVEAPGPEVVGAGTLASDRIEVGFDDGVEVTDVEGFRLYTDDACSEEFTHGAGHGGGGPFVDVELADAMDAEEDYFFQLDGYSVEGSEGFPNVPSECLDLSGGPISGDDDGGDEEGPQPEGASTFSGEDQIEVLFDTGVEVIDVAGFRVHTDDTCATEIAEGADFSGAGGFPTVQVQLSSEMTGEEGHWLRVEAGTVEDGDGTPNPESECLEIQGG